MISYRDANAGDGAVLGGIARATFIDTFGSLYKLEDMATFLAQGSDAAYGAELADPDIAVRFAETGGAPIGFCKISSLKLPASNPGPRAAELRQLYIYKPWQGLGIADVLTRWAMDTARARGVPKSGCRCSPITRGRGASMPAMALRKSSPIISWSVIRPMRTSCAGRCCDGRCRHRARAGRAPWLCRPARRRVGGDFRQPECRAGLVR